MAATFFLLTPPLPPCGIVGEQLSGKPAAASTEFRFSAYYAIRVWLTRRSHYGIIRLAIMHVVSHKAIRIFCREHPDASNGLNRWYKVAKRATWASFVEVKQSFNTADFVAPYIVFDVGGNQYRLIAEINFRRQVLFIRSIMTHKEYGKGAWKS